MKALTIGKAAREAGVGVETIRFYEREGMIEQPPKPHGPGFRIYSPEQIKRIKFIRQAQQIGFTLREIEELLSIAGRPQCRLLGGSRTGGRQASGSPAKNRPATKDRHRLGGSYHRLSGPRRTAVVLDPGHAH
jgi:DNA-binding transcriptional MerR regulator